MRRTTKSRRYSLGGSDAAAVLELNPYQTRFDAWVSKVTDLDDGFSENKYTYFGTIKEKVIAEHYAARHCVQLIESPKRVRDERPWQTGTPDRLIVAPDSPRKEFDAIGYYEDPISGKTLVRRGLEIKTALEKHTPKWHSAGAVSISDRPPMVLRTFQEADGAVPLNYYVQCAWYMELMDFEEWDLCVLIDSSDYREFRIVRDPSFIGWALDKCEYFWKHHVEKQIPPPVDHGSMVNKYLIHKYGHQQGAIREGDRVDNEMAKSFKELTAEFRALIEEEKALKEKVKDLRREQRKFQKEIDEKRKEHDSMANWWRDRIGYDEGISTEAGVITWKASERQSRTLRKKWN